MKAQDSSFSWIDWNSISVTEHPCETGHVYRSTNEIGDLQ
jgi:hypothetical protein